MRIKYCLIFLFLFSFSKLFAQEDPLFTFFPWGQAFYNPGAMGEKENHLNFVGILRQQSMGMGEKDSIKDKNNTNPDNGEFSNKSQGGQQVLIHIDSYIKQIKGAVGVTFLKDKNGDKFDNIGFRLGYAAKLRVRRGKLGIGVQLGFLNTKPTSSKLNPFDNPDDTVTQFEGDQASVMDFDMNFGLHYRTPTWYAGISCSRLLGGGVRISGDKDIIDVPQQLYVTGGYIWDLKTAIPWSIEPHLLIRTNLATWQLDLLALARYNGILWFGLSYQLDNAVAVLFGAVPFYNNASEYLKGLELGLAYSFDTKKFGYKANGSWGDFELVVRYGFNFYKEKVLTGYGSSRHLYKNQY